MGLLVAVLVGGLVLQRRDADSYADALTRVQLEAQAAGDAIDPPTYVAAWTANGGDHAAAMDTLVPQLAGARVFDSVVIPQSFAITVWYVVNRGIREGCVIMNRSEAGTHITAVNRSCSAVAGSG